MKDKKLIVLFDGVCNFCNGWVQLIIRNDKHDKFRFAALQSDKANQLLSGKNLDKESVVLIQHGKYYFHSSAALRIFFHMDGLWKLMMVFYIVPKFIRDVIYNFIARNRYKWFGKRDTCVLPDEKTRARFL